MLMSYRCVEVKIEKDVNIIDEIYKIIHKEDKYFNTRFQPHFIGFEAEEGTTFKINGMENRVPSCGYFITPYDGVNYITINSLYFNEGMDKLKIWVIY